MILQIPVFFAATGLSGALCLQVLKRVWARIPDVATNEPSPDAINSRSSYSTWNVGRLEG